MNFVCSFDKIICFFLGNNKYKKLKFYLLTLWLNFIIYVQININKNIKLMKEKLVISGDFEKYLSEQGIKIDYYENGVIRIRADRDDLIAKTVGKILGLNPTLTASAITLIPGEVTSSGLISIYGAIVVFSKKTRKPISDFRCGPSNIG